jgi:hypothetical protein
VTRYKKAEAKPSHLLANGIPQQDSVDVFSQPVPWCLGIKGVGILFNSRRFDKFTKEPMKFQDARSGSLVLRLVQPFDQLAGLTFTSKRAFSIWHMAFV